LCLTRGASASWAFSSSARISAGRASAGKGFKIGPLFAADGEMAEALFRGLADLAPGAPIFLDVPENNPQAMALAQRHGMGEVFGCARMYFGPPPVLPLAEIFGVTTFELG
jgi:hypothetical protein